MGGKAQIQKARNHTVKDLVVSAAQMLVYVLKGHDFSRAANGPK
jgi:hypothetical protein